MKDLPLRSLLVLGFLVPVLCQYFDPLELYAGADEGFALYHVDEQNGKNNHVYDIFSYHSTHGSGAYFGLHNDDLEVYQMKTYMNKIIIRKGDRPHTYRADLTFWDGHDIKHHHDHVSSLTDKNRYLKSVPLDNGGTVALQCKNNKYLKWGSSFSQHNEPCTSEGICSACKFRVEIGSLNPFFIEIVDIAWGEPMGDIVENPSVLATDQQNNWSDQIITNTFSISYTDTTVDTTTWKNSWGFEFGTSLETEVKFFKTGVKFTVSSTIKYSGEVGGSTSETSSTKYDKSAQYPCPGKHRCIFKLVGRHLNNAAIPFTATVRKTDGFQTETWTEEGIWEGVKVYDTYTEYNTEELGNWNGF